MISEVDSEDLSLPEAEFRYLAGSQERPWSHFTGRWQAMRPHLERMLKACGTERPLRIIDVGSCTGFFSLQAAHRHPEADVVALEGSVGIGNGTSGLAGSAREILSTGAVRTHLRWIQKLMLPNCFVAPEVWDFKRIGELASGGRPVADVMFLLSVVHHIDNCSAQQYADLGLSDVDGFIELMGRLLLLSPRHFVELPLAPWLSAAYNRYGTQRAILEAAAAASGRDWGFRGPIHTAEWFGLRELWVLEVKEPMAPLDLQFSPFPLLYQGEEQELAEAPDDPLNDLGSLDAYGAGRGASVAAAAGGGLLDSPPGAGDPAADLSFLGLPMPGVMGEDIALLGDLAACKGLGGALVDPGLVNLSGMSCPPVNPRVAEAVASAPSDLLIAHLTLREAITEAEDLLVHMRDTGALSGLPRAQRQGEQLQHHPQQSSWSQPPPPPPPPRMPGGQYMGRPADGAGPHPPRAPSGQGITQHHLQQHDRYHLQLQLQQHVPPQPFRPPPRARGDAYGGGAMNGVAAVDHGDFYGGAVPLGVAP